MKFVHSYPLRNGLRRTMGSVSGMLQRGPAEMVDWEEIEVLCTREPEAEPKGSIKEMFSHICNDYNLYRSVLEEGRPL